MIGVYVESWAVPWTSTGTASALGRIEKPIDTVFLAFASPACSYKKGQLTWQGTGLNFSSDFAVIQNAIAILKAKGIKVMLAVGGASYPFNVFYAASCAALMNDLGCDGLDIDWEPSDGIKSAAQLGPLIDQARQAMGSTKFLSLAAFSTGCFEPNGDTYRGMNIQGLQSNGYQLDWVNLMAYDAGKSFDALTAYDNLKKYFKRTVLFGFEVGQQGWGDAWLTLQDVEKACRYISAKGDGCFVWAYFKTGPPSAIEVCDAANRFLIGTPSTPVILCPHCQNKLVISKG